MKISLDWLKDWVDIDCSVDELAAKLVSAGFEVEEIIEQGADCVNVVVGRIDALSKHKDADKLQICSINIGKDENIQIVTGAQNVNVGDLVPVALDGSDLPCGMHIKKGKLRGEVSMGMLCSGGELNLTDVDYVGASVDGIMLLRDNWALGTDINAVIGNTDTILDVGVTANRPDCNSVQGIAYEVAAVLGKNIKKATIDLGILDGDSNNVAINVDVIDSDLCPHYMLGMVDNIVIKPSPKYIQKRLKAVGIRPINNIVDITNYILIEMGQPMHAFDLREIEGRHIVIRRATKSETIVTLDNKKYTLDESMLVICDAIKPIAVAGIMGGANSGIKSDTACVLFESAKFMRDNIRRTSNLLNLKSDSQARYERGIDGGAQSLALARAMQLIKETSSGDVVNGVIECCTEKISNRSVTASISKINAILGITVPNNDIIRILNSLNIIPNIQGDILTCDVPPAREDIENNNDLAEEIIRMYGYDNIISTLMDKGRQTKGGKTVKQHNVDKVKDLLVSVGMRETLTYSFTTPRMFDKLLISDDDNLRKVAEIINPLGEDGGIMRPILSYSMLEVVAKNLNRGNKNLRLFEVANTYLPHEYPMNSQPLEEQQLVIAMVGNKEDFYSMKGVIQRILLLFGLNEKYISTLTPYLHTGISANIMVNGDIIGHFGELHPNVMANMDIKDKVYIAEIKLDKLNSIYDNSYKFAPIPKFPAVERDIAVILKEEITSDSLITLIKNSVGKMLESVELFDVYRGKGVDNGYKSMAVRMRFQSVDKTLVDDEVNDKVNKILKKIQLELGGVLR